MKTLIFVLTTLAASYSFACCGTGNPADFPTFPKKKRATKISANSGDSVHFTSAVKFQSLDSDLVLVSDATTGCEVQATMETTQEGQVVFTPVSAVSCGKPGDQPTSFEI